MLAALMCRGHSFIYEIFCLEHLQTVRNLPGLLKKYFQDKCPFRGFDHGTPCFIARHLPLSHSALQQGDLFECINYKITDHGGITRQRMLADYIQTDKVPIWKVFTPSKSI